MSVTRTSTTVVATSTTVGTSDDDGTTTQTDTQTTTLNVSTEPVYEDNEDGLQLVLGGEANAIGEDTFAQGSVSSLVDDNGGSTLADGSATFEAEASSDGDAAFASAGSFADVSGADIVVSSTSTSSHTEDVDGETSWSETSTTNIGALDVEDGEPASDPADDDVAVPDDSSLPDDGSGTLDGNVAILTIDAQAYGDDTLIIVDATAITIEDQFSSVMGLVVTEVA